MKTLCEEDITRLRAQLKRYGIESPELLNELSDHYAEQMEERMAVGLSAEEAFAIFKRENSWLKLRKLEYRHAEQRAQTMQRMLKGQLFQLFLGPLSLFTYPMIVLIVWLSGQELGLWKHYFIAFHMALGFAATVMMLYILFLRLIKRQYFATLFQIALWALYLTVYLPIFAEDYFNFNFLAEGGLTVQLLFIVLYSVIGIVIFLFGKTFQWAFKQLRMDPNRV